MAKETQYGANTGMVTISTANANLDGTGTLGTVLTAGAAAAGWLGTIVKSVTIKATGTTTQGVVRLFITSGANTRIVAEVEVPAVTPGANVPAFETRLEASFDMHADDVLKASTEKAESFNVIAEGLNWTYYTTSERQESTKFTANTGVGQIATANSNLNGTGTIGDIITANASSNGTEITSVTVKAIVNTTAGMVRLFLYDGTNTMLLTEIPVEARTKSAKAHSFSRRITFNGQGFALKANWHLKASTEKGETFNVIAEGLDWVYP